MNSFHLKFVLIALCLGLCHAQFQRPGISPNALSGQIPYRGPGQLGPGSGSTATGPVVFGAGSQRPQGAAGAGSSPSGSAGGAPDSRFFGLLGGGGGLFGGRRPGGLFGNLFSGLTGNRPNEGSNGGVYAGGYPYQPSFPFPSYPGGGGGYPGFGGGYPGYGGGYGGFGGPGFYG